MGTQESNKGLFSHIDKSTFIPSVGILAIALVSIIFFPELTNKILSTLQSKFSIGMSWFIILIVGLNFFFLMWIALSKYGNIVLGETENDKPEFSTISWICMLFSAGVGIGFICFGVAEPIWHLYDSTHTVNMGTAGTPAGVPMGIQVSISNWGASCWALFAIGGLAIALPAYKKQLPMCISTGLYGLLGDKVTNSPWAKVVDVLGIIASVSGNAAALGMGILSISTAMNLVFGISVSPMLNAGIMLAIILIYIICTITGLDRGIKFMSNANVIVAGLLVIFILICGPSIYILNLFTEVTGLYVREFINMNFFTDAGRLVPREWLQWWPVFYWLWWISYIPFIGGFVARISRGRTLREFALGVSIAPVGFSLIWFTTLGGAGAWAQFVDGLKIWETMQSSGTEPAIYMLLQTYPMGTLACLIAICSLVTFTVTTSNSAAFFLAMQVSHGIANPSKSALILWGSILGAVGLGVAIIGGSEAMKALKALTVVGALPFCFVLGLYMISTYRMLKKIDTKTF